MKQKSGTIGLILAALVLTGMLTQARPFVRAVGLEGFVQEESRVHETEETQTQPADTEQQVWTEADEGNEQFSGGEAPETQEPLQTEQAQETQTLQDEGQEQPGSSRPAEMEAPSENMELQETWQTDTGMETPETESRQEAGEDANVWEKQTEYGADYPAVLTEPEGTLSAKSGNVEIILKKADGTAFPEDCRVWLISPEEAAMGDEEDAVRIEEMFRDDWKKILESAAMRILPYYVRITDGNHTALEEKARITFTVHDRDFFVEACEEEKACIAGIHCADKLIKAVKNPEVSVNKETETVKISLDIEKNGWVSLVCADKTAVSGIKEENGTEELGIQEPETELKKEDMGTENTETDENKTEESETEECETEESETEESETESVDTGGVGIQLLAAARAAAPDGTKLPAGAYTGVTSGMKASAEYNGIIYRTGVSGMETFGSPSSALVRGDMGAALYWQPKDADQKGICGSIYRKVLYNNANHQWYDIKLTLHAYTKSVTASDGKAHTCYPFAGFNETGFGFSFYRAGLYVLKGEVLNSSTQAKEKVKFRLNITDIDDMQLCAFKLGNGTIDKRYCMSDSLVYLKTNVTVAGVGGFEQLTGADGTIDSTDHRGDVIFDVNSSEFYLGIGYSDNHKRSWTNTIKPRYDKALAGALDGSYGYLGISAKSTILPIDIPTPAKQVSNDGSKWAAENKLTSVSDSFWYRLEQFVPQEVDENYYSKFVFTDQLPAGVDYAGKLSVVRAEDGKSVTSWFTCTAENDVIKAEAKASALEKSGFYGYHYIVKFAVKMDASEIKPQISGNSAVYTMKNKVTVTAKHKKDSADTKKISKEVTTTVSVKRPALSGPVKGLDKSKTAAEKNLQKRNEEIVFSIWQSFPSSVAQLAPKKVTMTDVLEDALEYSDFSVYTTTDSKTFTDKTSLFKAACKEQTVTVTGEKNLDLNNVTFRFDIKCRIKDGFDLSKYIKNGFYVIPNTAKVKVTYGYGDPAETENNTNTVTVKLEAPPPDAFLEITKEIDAADIVTAHGNPIFVFKAAGRDIKGKERTYYEAVEFTGQSEAADGKKRETAVIKVKAGVYTVTEERTMRYSFGGIHSVTQGTVSRESVVFDVSGAEGGSAVFYNKKTTDEEEGHTALVRNHIGK